LTSRSTMKFALAGALALSLPSAVASPAVAQSQAESGQLDRAVRALRAITTMKADFTQTDRSGQTLRGELTLKSPGKIRFQYSDDVNMLIVSDGRALSVIDYDVQQVERWPIRSSPLGALLDPGRDMTRYGRLRPTGTTGAVSIEVADPERPEFPLITLVFVESASAPGGLELNSWVAVDSQNTRTTVRLRNHRYGVSVADSAFTFRDPRRTTGRPG